MGEVVDGVVGVSADTIQGGNRSIEHLKFEFADKRKSGRR
jgi:hypothetical protein